MTEETNPAEQAFRFMAEIAIISQLSGAALEKLMPEGMTMSQFGVLNHLCRLGGEWSPVRLANAMQVTKAAMTNTLGHLSGKGLVVIRPDDSDGRAKLVSVTADGMKARDATVMALTPELAALVDGVSAETLAEAVPLLERVRRFLDQRRA
ncbi:MAG: MarR family transcriptional regulator [Proteobacteria bacterium]|nr:MarR family transcriptional regulator [Pseudomonadota bacterium]